MEEKELSIFNYINMINQKIMPEFDHHFEKVYSPFLVNKFFSFFPGSPCVIANEMNRHYNTPKKAHFLFMFSMIKKSKRFVQQWPKKENEKRINLIMDVYNYNYQEAKSCVNLITEEQFIQLEQLQYKGEMIHQRKK